MTGFTAGMGPWLLYGLGIGDRALIGSSAETLMRMLPILAMTLRHG